MSRRLALALILGAVLVTFTIPIAASAGSCNGSSDRRRCDWNQRDAPSLKEEKEREDKAEARAEAKAERARKRQARLDGEEEEEEAAAGERTYGRACMYGGNGEVVYRPEGARCKGDPDPTPTRRRAAPASLAEPTPAAKPAGSRKGCIYGTDGGVLHAPKGSDC